MNTRLIHHGIRAMGLALLVLNQLVVLLLLVSAVGAIFLVWWSA